MPVFKHREKLSPRYIPDKLPHRERELGFLVKFFKDLMPGSGSPAYTGVVQLQGAPGLGKTSVAVNAARFLVREASERGINLHHVHLNLGLEAAPGSKFVFYSRLAAKVDPHLVSRSISPEELLMSMLNYLKRKNLYLFVVIDEVDYYVKKTGGRADLIFELTRLDEVSPGEPSNVVGMVFIARDSKWRSKLDPAARSSLGNVILDFAPYTPSHLFDIISYRVSLAFREGAVSNEVLEYVVDITYNHARSDVRFALDILSYAGTLAENEGSSRVTLDHIREAVRRYEPPLTSEDIEALSDEERLVLLAVARALSSSKTPYVGIEEIWSEYSSLYEVRKRRARRKKFFEALHSLYSRGIVNTKGVMVEIPGVPVERLRHFLESIVERLS